MGLRRIAIVGAGGMAREVASAIHWINRAERRFEFLGYVVSDISKLGERDSRETVIGDFDWVQNSTCSGCACNWGGNTFGAFEAIARIESGICGN